MYLKPIESKSLKSEQNMGNLTKNRVIPAPELLIRMERNHTAMHRLLQKLSSYTCEPNNKSCFEKLYELRQDFKSFSDRQLKLTSLLKAKKDIDENLNREVEYHLKSFKQLESDMASYLLDTNQYY